MARRLLGVGLGTAGGTGKGNGADNGILGIHEFETLEVEVADLESLAKTEVVNIDDNALGDFGIDSLNLDFLHREVELTTGLHTFGVAFELDGHEDGDRLLIVHLEKVHVEDGVLHRVELDVLEDSHTLLAVDGELDGENVGSIDELTHCVLRYH